MNKQNQIIGVVAVAVLISTTLGVYTMRSQLPPRYVPVRAIRSELAKVPAAQNDRISDEEQNRLMDTAAHDDGAMITGDEFSTDNKPPPKRLKKRRVRHLPTPVTLQGPVPHQELPTPTHTVRQYGIYRVRTGNTLERLPERENCGYVRSEISPHWLHYCLLRHYFIDSPLNHYDKIMTENEMEHMMRRMTATEQEVYAHALPGATFQQELKYLPLEVQRGWERQVRSEGEAIKRYMRDPKDPDNEDGRRIVNETQLAYPPRPVPPSPTSKRPPRTTAELDNEHP